MHSKRVLATALAGVALVASQDSLCDKYTKALLTDNTAANQYTLLQLVVNTVVIGNYTQPNVGISVPGILAPATFGGEEVNLLPYFNGCLKSSNRGKPTAINFLDGGAAASIIDGSILQNTGSRQYTLLTHLYEFFGTLLGCSQQGQEGFPAYDGQASMFEVHKYMALDVNEVGYFISQVGLAAASFGVSTEDVTTVGTLLGNVFNVACAPAQALVNGDSEFQSICVAESCPRAQGAVCDQYENGGFFPEPMGSGNPGCPPVENNGTDYNNGSWGGHNGGGKGEGKGEEEGEGKGEGKGEQEGGNVGSGKGGKGVKGGKSCPYKHKHRKM